MSEQNRQNQKPENTKRSRKKLWLAAIILVIAVICCLLLWDLLKSKSVDKQLAAIEAARAIPPEENAAVIYNQLLEDPNAAVPIDPRPEFLDYDSFNQTIREPWLSKDYPELAAWVEERQDTIERLFEACGFEECRFPIVIDPRPIPGQADRFIATRKWAYLLRLAANNDIAEGRTDDAIAKWRCLVRMGEHLRQQPSQLEDVMAITIDAIALQLSAIYIVEGDAVETRLRQIESLRFDTKDNWAGHAEQIRIVQDLTTQKLKEQFGPIDHVKYLLNYRIYGMAKPSTLDDLHKVHLRHVASRRGNHILIALRRYKNKFGHWPERLDEIKSSLRTEVLTDPQNNGPFVYKLTEGSFMLYSKGKNNIDENGRRNSVYDPKSNEYVPKEDDELFWPPRGRKPKTEKEENANGK